MISPVSFNMAAYYFGATFKTKYCGNVSLWCKSKINVYKDVVSDLHNGKFPTIFFSFHCTFYQFANLLRIKDSTIEFMAGNGTSSDSQFVRLWCGEIFHRSIYVCRLLAMRYLSVRTNYFMYLYIQHNWTIPICFVSTIDDC